MNDYQAWLEQPYERAGDEIDGECNVNLLGLNLDIMVEANKIGGYNIVGIEDREEAIECAERASQKLGRPFDALSFSDGQIIDLIHDAFIPGDLDMDAILEAVEENNRDCDD